MTSKETLCSGCGATVTLGMGIYPTGNKTWRDASYSAYCACGSLPEASAVLHYVDLPPVAIAPDPQHTPKWKANKIIYPAGQDVSFEVLDESGDIVCQTIMREVIAEDERIAIDAQRIKLFAAAPDILAALKELLARINNVSNLDDGCLYINGRTAEEFKAPIAAAEKAISKTEDFMEEARRTR